MPMRLARTTGRPSREAAQHSHLPVQPWHNMLLQAFQQPSGQLLLARTYHTLIPKFGSYLQNRRDHGPDGAGDSPAAAGGMPPVHQVRYSADWQGHLLLQQKWIFT